MQNWDTTECHLLKPMNQVHLPVISFFKKDNWVVEILTDYHTSREYFKIGHWKSKHAEENQLHSKDYY